MMIMHGERSYRCHSDFNGQMISEALHCISGDFNFYLSTSNVFQENEEDWGKDFGEEVQEEDFFNNILLLRRERGSLLRSLKAITHRSLHDQHAST